MHFEVIRIHMCGIVVRGSTNAVVHGRPKYLANSGIHLGFFQPWATASQCNSVFNNCHYVWTLRTRALTGKGKSDQ